MPRLAANLSMMFTEHPFLDRIDAAARHGFAGVEFLFPYEHPAAEIASRLERHGLTQALFNAPPGDWVKGERGVAIFPDRRAEFAAGLDIALSYAKALCCEKLHVMAGIVPVGADPARLEATYVANLQFAADRAAPLGIQILIEPLNPRDMPGYYLMSFGEARDVLAKVARPNAKLQLDLYHRQMTGGGLADATREFWPLTGHIQIAGVPGRHEPDVGEINYSYLFELIDSLGYDGWVGCEYRPRAATAAGLSWAKPYGISV